MISTSSLVLDGHHGHGLGPGPGPGPGGPHHMAFMDPYLRSGKLPTSVPEFIRPLPKPAPIVPRYNGQRPPPSQSPRKDYQNVPVSSTASSGPVNLTSVKHDNDNITDTRTSGNMQIPHLAAAPFSSRIYPPPGFHYPGLQNPYGSLYPSHHFPPSLLNRPTYINSTPLSPLERQYSPPQATNGSGNSPAFLQPPSGYSSQNTQAASAPTPAALPPPPPPPPPPATKPGQSLLRDKKPFKIPPGKDANGKQQKLLTSSKSVTKRVTLSSNINNNSNNNNNNNNNLLPSNFTKGALIELANGELKTVENVTTEELVSSAEKCSAFRLDPSTVVRIEENSNGTVVITLSYGENKETVEIESTSEHPFFVYGQGWASCSPERTMNCFGLPCHRLQVGDICISLSPRPPQSTARPPSNRSNSSSKTAQISKTNSSYQTRHSSDRFSPKTEIPTTESERLKNPELDAKSENNYRHDSSDEEKNCKRRRWSAPDQFEAEDEFIDVGSPSPSHKRKKEENEQKNVNECSNFQC